jgi:pimeloyl-ACP methyl ester carboxylesterase
VTPLYFGSSDRRLFGLYESARSPSRNVRAVLFCHAWGTEYVNSYRAVRFAASRLVAAGFCALRFDYYGSGDSEGDSSEAELSGLEADIETAMDELRELSQARLIALFGIRLGATLAARVAARAPRAISRLVLWDPIVVGATYVEELIAKAPLRGASWEPSRVDELDGLRVSPAFASEMNAIDLVHAPPNLPEGTIVVNTVSDCGPVGSELIAPPILIPQGSKTISSHAPAPWAAAVDAAAALPVDAIEQIIQQWR